LSSTFTNLEDVGKLQPTLIKSRIRAVPEICLAGFADRRQGQAPREAPTWFLLKNGYSMYDIITSEDEVVFVGRYFPEGAFALNVMLNHDMRGGREHVDKVIVRNSRTGVMRMTEVVLAGPARPDRIQPYHYIKPGLEGLLKALSARAPHLVISSEISGKPMVCLKWIGRCDDGTEGEALFVLTAPDERMWLGEPEKFHVSWIGKASEWPYLDGACEVAQVTPNPDQANCVMAIWPEARHEVCVRPCLIASSKGVVQPKYYFNIEKLRW
jgi:hypothetical protein